MIEGEMAMGFLMDDDGVDSLIYEHFHDYEYNPYKNLEYMVYVKESDFGGAIQDGGRYTWKFGGISNVDLFEVDFENGEFCLASRVTKGYKLKDVKNELSSKVFDRDRGGRTIRVACDDFMQASRVKGLFRNCDLELVGCQFDLDENVKSIDKLFMNMDIKTFDDSITIRGGNVGVSDTFRGTRGIKTVIFKDCELYNFRGLLQDSEVTELTFENCSLSDSFKKSVKKLDALKVLSPCLRRLEFVGCSDELLTYFKKLVNSSNDFKNLKLIIKD